MEPSDGANGKAKRRQVTPSSELSCLTDLIAITARVRLAAMQAGKLGRCPSRELRRRVHPSSEVVQTTRGEARVSAPIWSKTEKAKGRIMLLHVHSLMNCMMAIMQTFEG